MRPKRKTKFADLTDPSEETDLHKYFSCVISRDRQTDLLMLAACVLKPTSCLSPLVRRLSVQHVDLSLTGWRPAKTLFVFIGGNLQPTDNTSCAPGDHLYRRQICTGVSFVGRR